MINESDRYYPNVNGRKMSPVSDYGYSEVKEYQQALKLSVAFGKQGLKQTPEHLRDARKVEVWEMYKSTCQFFESYEEWLDRMVLEHSQDWYWLLTTLKP